jgi:hypothetical protein
VAACSVRTSTHGRDRAADRAGFGDRDEAEQEAMNFRRCWLVLGVTAVSLAACAPSAAPPDTPITHLSADVAAMKASPATTISPGCAAALQELTSQVKDINAIQQQGKPVDAVSTDVLESDQDQAEAVCHPDAVRICRTPATPEAARACHGVVGMAPYPNRVGG